MTFGGFCLTETKREKKKKGPVRNIMFTHRHTRTHTQLYCYSGKCTICADVNGWERRMGGIFNSDMWDKKGKFGKITWYSYRYIRATHFGSGDCTCVRIETTENE